MNSKTEFKNGSWMQFKNLLAVQSGVLLLFLVAASDVAYPMIVTNCTEANLRAAMAAGGTVTFACDGTITLTNAITIATDTVLDGSGSQMTISGGNFVRVFQVNTNFSLTLIGLTIANGLSTNGCGGGIYNCGTVNASNCVFSSNGALGTNAPHFSAPVAGGDAYGGAIYSAGTLNADLCSFLENVAIGGAGNDFPSMGLPYFSGQSGDSGATAGGGAVCNLGTMTISRCLLASNVATGGKGARGQHGWSGLTYPQAGGGGGRGGNGAGAALFNGGEANLVNCTVAWNRTVGGQGGMGGGGGYLFWEGREWWSYGGDGGNGGQGLGAIHSTNSLLKLTNCTIAANSSGGGDGNLGGTGQPGGRAGTNGLATVGGMKTLGAASVNTLFAYNVPTNCVATITDAGHNLSSDASCGFTNVSSMNSTDPMLGTLADNGGPTLAMALLPGSPAIDAGDNAAAPPTDQRGYPRPIGSAADIGAYECSPPVIADLLPGQTTEIGATVDLWASVFDPAPLYYQWFLDGNAITGCTNCFLRLSGIQATNVGTYSVVVSNIFGAVTSAPVMLNVVAPVDRRLVLGITVMGKAGSSLNVEFTSALDSQVNWLPLDTVSLTSTSEFCFDLSEPLPPQRFYRAWQSGTPGVIPSLSLAGMVPAITLTGNINDSLRLDYINATGPTDAWVTLDTVTLTNTSQFYFDVSAIGQPPRLWRIVPAP